MKKTIVLTAEEEMKRIKIAALRARIRFGKPKNGNRRYGADFVN